MASTKNIITYPVKKFFASELLQMYRVRTGLTQAQFAQLLGFKTPRMIQYWEGGQNLPRAENLRKLITLLLNQEIFIAGQEAKEAKELWSAVKNSSDTRLDDDTYTPYPVFDEQWFDELFNQRSLKDIPITSQVDLATTTQSSLLSTPPLTSQTNSNFKTPPHNLPLQLTSFIGRNQELATIRHLLKTSRLLTITGVGGAGKSRLALQTASQELLNFRDGVWLVELFSISDGQLIIQAIIQTLGIKERLNEDLQTTLVKFLKARKLILILDTCEHLIAACAELVATLLKVCPELQIITTSRETLNVGGEVVWRVPALSMPASKQNIDLDNLAQANALELFLERAKAIQPGFTLTAQNSQNIYEICKRLDGIPLAIELAAARTKIFSTQQILERLEKRVSFLTGGDKGKALRQQTLKDTIDWSYNLLSKEEKLLFQRLAIFVGGWSLEAAEKVCSDNNLGEKEIPDLLQQLIDKSLVVIDNYSAEQQWQIRYRFLDTIHEYALEKLEASGELHSVEEYHTQYYLALAEKAEYGLWTHEQKEWVWRLQAERDNLWKLLNSSRQPGGNGEIGIRVAGALWWYWYIKCSPSEGEKWLVIEMLEQSRNMPLAYRVKILNGIGGMYFLRGNFKQAAELEIEAIAISRAANDLPILTFCLGCLAMQMIYLGEFEKAKNLTRESLMLARQIDDKRLIMDELIILGIASVYSCDLINLRGLLEESLQLSHELGNLQCISYSLMLLGFLTYYEGNLIQAIRYLKEGLHFAQEIDDRRMVCETLNQLSIIELVQHNYETAEEYLKESLELGRESGNPQSIAVSLQNFGKLALHRQNYEAAGKFLAESLNLFFLIGDKRGAVGVLEDIAELAYKQRNLAQVVFLLSASTYLRTEIKVPRIGSEYTNYEKNLDLLEAEVDDEIFLEFWTIGQTSTIEQVVSLAQKLLK